jgi:hypothetical protein
MVHVVYADDTTHRVLAEELLEVMETQKNIEYIEKTLEIMTQRQLASLQKMEFVGEEFEKFQSLTKQIMDMIAKEMSWDNMKDDYITIYADTFTEEELKGIIEFYKSPVGRKFTKKTPELLRRSMELSQKKMEELTPKIKSMLEEMIKELVKGKE